MAQTDAPERETLTPEDTSPPTQAPDERDEAQREVTDSDNAPEEEIDLDALLAKVDPEKLRKHKRIAGIAGDMAQKLATREAERLAGERAEAILREREERWKAEQSRNDLLAKARNGDFYALGEQYSRQLFNEDQQRAVEGYTRQTESQTYKKVQSVLEEWAGTQPQEVNLAAAERMGEVAQDATWEQGFRKWLDAYVMVRAEHLAAQPETKQRAERDAIPAVRARVLADMNGKEPTADSGSGRPQRVRTITDDDIARMSLDEYISVWDVEQGKPKPGVVYKPTRAVDPRAMQAGGRGF